MSPDNHETSSEAAQSNNTELIERLRGADGEQVRAALLAQLSVIERRLSQEAGILQSTARMKQIEAARLAVQNASAILKCLVLVDDHAVAAGASTLQTLFRSHSHDQ